jgi:hypothetical protein
MESLSPPSSTPFPTFNPVASFVSAFNLHRGCPSTLLQALATSHQDCEVWLQSYYKEKSGIESLRTLCCISLGEYWALHEKDAPMAIPTICILTIKKDEQLMPHWAKSCNEVLGNQEDRNWSKSGCFVLVLCFDSL